MNADCRLVSSRLLMILLLVAVALLSLALYRQQQQIDALEREVSALSAHDAGAPLARIANLEGIANAHTEHLRDLDRKVYRLRVDQADLDWRTTTNRWDIDAR